MGWVGFGFKEKRVRLVWYRLKKFGFEQVQPGFSIVGWYGWGLGLIN